MPEWRWRLGLRGKLLAMMFGLLLLAVAALFLLYWRAEAQLITQVERLTLDLGTALQISVEQLTSKGRTAEARLQDYVRQLQQRGVREISILSNEEEVIASSNPRRVGVRVDPRRKDLLITARLGEETGGRVPQRTHNLIMPIVVGSQRSGYILISLILDDFAELARINFLKRMATTILVFGVGIAGAVALAYTYHKPISQVVEAARRVAQGQLDERLPTGRRDEIGELNRSFNEMVDGLREKADLEARLARAERHSAIAHLSSGIAHEVRNPLSTISMTIGHLAAQHAPSTPAAREEYLRLTSMVMQEIRRLDNMIETFLRYGKPLLLQPRETELRTLLEAAVATQRIEADARRVRVALEIPAELPGIWADPALLQTCFANLILNALQAMPEGGSLVVAAAEEAGRPGWVEVRVEDTGVGIPPEALDKVFEPYFTTREVGIGLGLALTRKIVEEHGGEISLASQPGRGTTARVRLPLGEPRA